MKSESLSGRKQKERRSVLPILTLIGYDESAYDWMCECPDCRLSTPDGIVGIEVVRCCNEGDEVRRMHHLFDNACQKCEDYLSLKDVSNKFISVYFYDSWQRTPPDLKTHEFIDAVIKEIERHLEYDKYLGFPEYLTNIEEYKRLNQLGAFNYRYVESISVLENHIGVLEVSPVTMYFVPDIAPSAVQKCIDKKNQKLNQYRAHPNNRDIKEYWLFIAIEWESFTDLGNLPNLEFSSEFRHIYICDHDIARCLK